jgi:3-isopropylmalate dehydrogenase
MLLDHIGEREAAKVVLGAIEQSIRGGFVTRDMGGTRRTSEVGEHIASLVME